MRFQNRLILFFFLSFFFFGCGSNTYESALNEELDALNDKNFTWGGLLEESVVDSCLFEDVTLGQLERFIRDGGDVNAYVKRTYTSQRMPFGTRIPIVKEFVSKEPIKETDIYRMNVLQALLSRSPENKMEMCCYLLQQGANPNLMSPEGHNALDYLLFFLAQPGTHYYEREFSKNASWPYKDDIYTTDYIDTLLVYGALPSKANLDNAGSNYYLLKKMLDLGADPKTIDINELLDDDYSDTEIEQLPEILKYGADYSELMGNNVMLSEKSYEIVDAMFKGGFNANSTLSDNSYLLDKAIEHNKFFIVKLIVENGGNKVTGFKNPYLFAKEKAASESIVNYLKEKFGTK